MLPIKLTIKGIRRYVNETQIDFSRVTQNRLFAITGETAAGKSTIFDGILLALFGRLESNQKSGFITLGKRSGEVAFEFEHDGKTYTVEREFKAQTTAELRCGDDVIASGVNDVNAKIVTILGMGLKEFSQVVLLCQGEYAKFLTSTGKEQQDLLGGVFSLTRFDKLHSSANGKLKVLEEKLSNITKDLDAVKTATKEIAATKKREYNALEKEKVALEKLIEKLKKAREELSVQRDTYEIYKRAVEKKRGLEGDLKTLNDEREKIVERTAQKNEQTAAQKERERELESLSKKREEIAVLLRDEKRLTELSEKIKSEKTLLKTSDESRDNKAKDLKRASDLLKAENDKLSAELSKLNLNADALESEVRAVSDFKIFYQEKCKQRAEAAAKCAEAEHEIKKQTELAKIYTKGKDECEKKLESDKAAIKAAECALTNAMRENAAEAICAELKDGELCPVCGGVYTKKEHVHTNLDDLKAALETLKTKEEDAKSALVKAESERNNALSEVVRAGNRKDEETLKISEIDRAIRERAADPEAYLKREELLNSANERRKKIVDLNAKVDMLRSECDSSEKLCEEKSRQIKGYEREASEITQKIGARVIEDELSGITARESELKAERDKFAKAEERLAADTESNAKRISQIQDALKEIGVLKEVVFDSKKAEENQKALDDANDKLIENKGKSIEAKHAYERAECDYQKKDELEKQKREVQNERDEYKRLEELLRGDGLKKFVTGEYTAEITARADEIFGTLTRGGFSLMYDTTDGFKVADYLASGETRPISTLSGGEKFMASLSAAVSISEIISSGSNGIFFMDEGFGTLDEKLTDVVADALTAISERNNCVIGLISHSKAIIDRMPAYINVTFSEADGSTVEYGD